MLAFSQQKKEKEAWIQCLGRELHHRRHPQKKSPGKTQTLLDIQVGHSHKGLLNPKPLQSHYPLVDDILFPITWWTIISYLEKEILENVG